MYNFAVCDAWFLHDSLYQAADWSIASFYNWLLLYAWISCYSTPNVANWQKPPPMHTLLDPQAVTRWRKACIGLWWGVAAPPSTGSFRELNSMQNQTSQTLFHVLSLLSFMYYHTILINAQKKPEMCKYFVSLQAKNLKYLVQHCRPNCHLAILKVNDRRFFNWNA